MAKHPMGDWNRGTPGKNVPEEEIAVLEYEEEVFRFVGGIESLPDEGDVRSEKTRAWYCQLLLNNGVLAAVYEAYHPAFYAWLRCASK